MEIRYDRQSRIPDWNQEKISRSKVAVIGAGALGNHVCLGLIGLGIGTIKIFDFDKIEIHNLNRQSVFCEKDVGRNKAEALADNLRQRNSKLNILHYSTKIKDDNIDDMLLGVDLIIDCVDRISVRRTLSRFCLRKNIPLVHGGISFIGGQTAILTRETPCINCIYPDAEQEEDMKRETGCINQPDNSVVYTSQIIAGIMVNLVRRVLCPLSEKIDSKDKEFGLIKLHLEMNPPVYIARVKRRATCECIDILKKVAPNILLKEKQLREIEEKKKKEDENVALAALIGKK